MYCKPKYRAILFKIIWALIPFYLIWVISAVGIDQCAVYILYFKISTDPGLLKIRHSHRFVAVFKQILIPFEANNPYRDFDYFGYHKTRI